MSKRTPQFCHACKKIDSHPRHNVYNVDTQESSTKHFDCCASEGCQVCLQALAGIPEKFRSGDALVAYLTKEVE